MIKVKINVDNRTTEATIIISDIFKDHDTVIVIDENGKITIEQVYDEVL